MKYRLVAMDGTLLNGDNEIPEENVTTIRELKKLGIHFVLVTGRSDAATKQYVKELGIEAPVLDAMGRQ